jgi:hypothetical protein
MKLTKIVWDELGPDLLGGKFSLPYSVDFSTLADGPLPSRLSGATWAISSGKAVNTPTLLGELVADGGLEAWISATNLTSWSETLNGTSTINQETTEHHGGSNCARLDIDASNNIAQIYQTLTAAVANWLHIQWYAKGSDAAATGGVQISRANIANFSAAPGVAWALHIASGIITTANPQPFFKPGSAASKSLYFDDITAELLSTPTLFATLPETIANVRVKANCNIAAESLAGVVSKLDSKTNPQNYVVLSHDGRDSLQLVKVVAGAPAVVATVGSLAYVAGAGVELRWTANDTVQMFYNDSKKGTDQTISDAGIIANKIHGAFSTYGGNSLDSFFAEAA